MNHKKTFLGVGAIILIVVIVYFFNSRKNPENTQSNFNEKINPISSDGTITNISIPDENENPIEELALIDYTVGPTSFGWEVKNEEGKILQIEQGKNGKMVLANVGRTNVNRNEIKNYSNFEDLHLRFTGTTTIDVKFDNTRTYIMKQPSTFYWPVVVSTSSLEKLPFVKEDLKQEKFCITDMIIEGETFEQKYANEKSYTFNNYSLIRASNSMDGDCTHLLKTFVNLGDGLYI